MKILLITGGDSSEREVSFLSANNVKKVLEENRREVLLYDLCHGYDPIVKLSENYNILFPVLHGEEGEGGKLHKFLSKLGKPIVGTRSYKGLHDAWLKIPFKEYCDKNGIKTAGWKIVSNEQEVLEFGFPCVLKASNGGSSKEVVLLSSAEDLKRGDSLGILKMKDIFVEKLIEGIEVTVGILNDEVLPIIEIVPTKHKWFSFDAKYDESTKEIPFAPSVDEQTQNELKRVTKKIRDDFDLGSYLRVDYIVSGKDFYALDVNTIVGLTAGSLYPKMAKAAGLSFGEFLEELLKAAN
ncbi:MAG: ATP-grasp domain-containing protein [Patescibacteria group bacterium]